MPFASIIREMNTSETSVNFYQTTRRNNPEDSHLHTRRRENLKYHIYYKLIILWNRVLDIDHNTFLVDNNPNNTLYVGLRA
jgi:hypothetical protein